MQIDEFYDSLNKNKNVLRHSDTSGMVMIPKPPMIETVDTSKVIKNYEKDIAAAKKEMSEHQKNMASIQEQITTARNLIKTLEDESDIAYRSIERCKERISGDNAKIDTLRSAQLILNGTE